MSQALLEPDMDQVQNLIDLSLQFPDLDVEDIAKGGYRLTLADQDAPVFVEYYPTPRAGINNDPWTFKFSHKTAQRAHIGPFTHPTQRGCWIAARDYFAQCGYLEVPKDHSHLSTKTAQLIMNAQRARDMRRIAAQPKPEEGDFVVDLKGDTRRICIAQHGNGCQTTTALHRSYHIGSNGNASYSGTCGKSVEFTHLSKSPETQPAMFWTFRDGRAGAGRGIEAWINVTVWAFDGVFGAGMWGKG